MIPKGILLVLGLWCLTPLYFSHIVAVTNKLGMYLGVGASPKKLEKIATNI
jgi:hypothetical protein